MRVTFNEHNLSIIGTFVEHNRKIFGAVLRSIIGYFLSIIGSALTAADYTTKWSLQSIKDASSLFMYVHVCNDN